MLMSGSKIRRIFPVATASAGLGERVDSKKTPRGWHAIAEKHGDDCPSNAVFVGRRWTQELYSQELDNKNPERDWILTRILWLQGMEPGNNQGKGCDSYTRYIYIHGAPEAKVNRGRSTQGCINLTTPAMRILYKLVEVGTPVHIAESVRQNDFHILLEKAHQVQDKFHQPVEQ